jgi:hypothetical protein
MTAVNCELLQLRMLRLGCQFAKIETCPTYMSTAIRETGKVAAPSASSLFVVSVWWGSAATDAKDDWPSTHFVHVVVVVVVVVCLFLPRFSAFGCEERSRQYDGGGGGSSDDHHDVTTAAAAAAAAAAT